MIVLIYIYRILILPIISIIVNLYFLLSNKKDWPKLKIKRNKIFKKIKKLDDVINFCFDDNFKYIPDLWHGFLNFINWNLTFILRGGGDCSGWSDILHSMLKKCKIKHERYLLINGWNIFTSHIITIVPKINNYYDIYLILFNVNRVESFASKESIFDAFRKNGMVLINDNIFNYDKLKVYRWF